MKQILSDKTKEELARFKGLKLRAFKPAMTCHYCQTTQLWNLSKKNMAWWEKHIAKCRKLHESDLLYGRKE